VNGGLAQRGAASDTKWRAGGEEPCNSVANADEGGRGAVPVLNASPPLYLTLTRLNYDAALM
jgi:hypothetical protein